MTKPVLDANLIKKYHQDLVFNYAEYPTCDHWDYNFGSKDYKKSLVKWLSKNRQEPIFFYVHVPFCEELCYFCTCSKIITSNYETIKDYLYNYLFKEIDMLFDHLNENNINLNVRTVFFGGGSPTIFHREDLKNLVDKLKGFFDFSKVGNFTVEIDPRRVDEDRLLWNHEACGANRLSFGLQDFDATVQRRVNRIQPPEVFKNILTEEVRKVYKTIAFDLLIGQPGQTLETMSKTCDQIIELEPTLIQLSLMAYKPWVAKYQVRMVAEGPLPDFLDRKELVEVINEKLVKAGYLRTGFECYSLPTDSMTKAFKEGTAHYGASGHQTGGRVNFVAVGSSSKGNLGNDYYSQSFYDLPSYKKCIDNGKFPTFRGMKLTKDDKIRQHATQQLRSYFKIDFKQFENLFKINPKEYFSVEIEYMKEMIKDGLIIITDGSIEMTEIGREFSQNIMNVFDKYDPPTKSYEERLETINKAKLAQADVQKELINLN
tara:strand:+ start:9219 stop:10679 length:1461 start_codon:yes stop_codon:yes gene_type:complete